LTGKGDDVVAVIPSIIGLTTAQIVHRGHENFIVHSYSPGGVDGLVNEIGNYSGQVRLPEGTVLMTFQADGAWSVAVEP
jgi:hypothetical protein